MSPADRVLATAAARDLLERARKERGLLPAAAPDRSFLLGVDAAALEVVTRTALADARRRNATSIPIPHPGERH